MAEIYYTVSPHLHRMACKEDGIVTQLDFEIPGKPLSLLGGIYLGRVVEIQKPLQAAFVNLGQSSLGLLPLREGNLPPVRQGETVLVQVNRTENPLEDKGVRLTRLLTLSLGPLLYTPMKKGLSLSKKIKKPENFRGIFPLSPEEGLVVRHNASQNDPLLDLFVQLQEEWNVIQTKLSEKPPFCVRPPFSLLNKILRSLNSSRKLVVDDRKVHLFSQGRALFSPLPAFDEVCEEAWESLFSSEIPMIHGGNLFIEETKALAVIDVNSKGALKSVLSFNRAAIKEALRQICLRELGGKIIIDLIGAPQELAPLLQGINIPSEIEIFGLSSLHLLEMIRRRQCLSVPQRLKMELN